MQRCTEGRDCLLEGSEKPSSKWDLHRNSFLPQRPSVLAAQAAAARQCPVQAAAGDGGGVHCLWGS